MWHIVTNKKWSETSRNTHTNIQQNNNQFQQIMQEEWKKVEKCCEINIYVCIIEQVKNKYAIQS